MCINSIILISIVEEPLLACSRAFLPGLETSIEIDKHWDRDIPKPQVYTCMYYEYIKFIFSSNCSCTSLRRPDWLWCSGFASDKNLLRFFLRRRFTAEIVAVPDQKGTAGQQALSDAPVPRRAQPILRGQGSREPSRGVPPRHLALRPQVRTKCRRGGVGWQKQYNHDFLDPFSSNKWGC